MPASFICIFNINIVGRRLYVKSKAETRLPETFNINDQDRCVRRTDVRKVFMKIKHISNIAASAEHSKSTIVYTCHFE